MLNADFNPKGKISTKETLNPSMVDYVKELKRLNYEKDIQEFLLYVHLGNKSSWHISQGEADRVLSANALDRKTLIEDALGLKVYHARINESGKKLEKTRENIREASLQRKEIMPELSMLARTVDKIKRSSEFRSELTDKAKVFISYRKNQIIKLKSAIPLSNGEGLGERGQAHPESRSAPHRYYSKCRCSRTA
jgi:hypothetical protein